MISKDIQEKLLGIISREMIPEYKKSIAYKEKLKEVYVKWVTDEFITKRDQELISKYPDFIKTSDKIPVAYFYRYNNTGEIDVEYFKGYFSRENDLILVLDHPMPVVIEKLIDLKSKDEKAWNLIGPHFHRYINARNSYVKKYNIAYDFLAHKNTTITFIKKEFPELYKLYKDDNINNRD